MSLPTPETHTHLYNSYTAVTPAHANTPGLYLELTHNHSLEDHSLAPLYVEPSAPKEMMRPCPNPPPHDHLFGSASQAEMHLTVSAGGGGAAGMHYLLAAVLKPDQLQCFSTVEDARVHLFIPLSACVLLHLPLPVAGVFNGNREGGSAK